MAATQQENNENNILYEIVVLSEWFEDYDSVISKKALNNTLRESSYFNIWNSIKKCKLRNLRFLETAYPWHLAVSKDGKVIAVLQETLLEIKTAKDEFSSVVGKAVIPNDENPRLRKLQWSADNSYLAIARDNGCVLVCNLFGCTVATVEPLENANETEQVVVGLCFLQTKFDSAKWSNELLIVYRKGYVKSILLSQLDGYESDENIKYSLENYYPEGISSVAYFSHNLLAIAGTASGNESGITVWRILNDYPYLKAALDSLKSPRSSRSFFRLLPGFSNQSYPKTVIQMQVSPDERSLACLHLSGEISIWRLPGISLERKWSLKEQPHYNRASPFASNETLQSDRCFYPVDIGWWSNDALVIARQNGALSVCTVKNLDNILGDSPEFLAESPQISSIVSDRSGVIVLECETTCSNGSRPEDEQNVSDRENESSSLEATIKATIYSYTDIEIFEPARKTPKVKQKTYRLLALKRTTPEELYARKIDLEDYEEALLLAKKYNLDCDLVYQKRWRNSQVSKESINDYLDKVKKILWVVKECVERVPDNLEDAKELLEFGLKKTQLRNKNTKNLNKEQEELIVYRRTLLKFLDNLTIYEKIIDSPSKYNPVEYDAFRRKPAIVATVNFAREEYWKAVAIMFTYASEKVLSHWLPVVSNFPETLRPLVYRSLLPEVVDGAVLPWETKKLRDPDWSEIIQSESFVPGAKERKDDDEILYEVDGHLKEFRCAELNADLVGKWYTQRTYELESMSGLVDNALSFVVLAKERGIKNLNEVHNDLLTLESLVYLVEDEDITLAKLELLSHLDQCKLLLSKTCRETFVDDLKNLIVPFAKRWRSETNESAYILLRDIFLHFSEQSLELLLEFLTYLKEGFLNPFGLTVNEMATIALDCIYSCPKTDELENSFLLLECLPQREKNESRETEALHDRIDRLEIHLEACDILVRYETPKSVRFLHKNENNAQVGKELMENMADFAKRVLATVRAISDFELAEIYFSRESLDFVELLSDLQFIQSKVFRTVPPSHCYELCALSQMSCECEEIIESAEDLMECRREETGKPIPFQKSVELVLKAARAHFEKATSFDDYRIQLAQTCLKIIGEPHQEIYEELDLIEAVQLLGDFQVNILPLQVRKQEKRLELINRCLTARSKNYKSCQKLLQLAQTLRIYGDDRAKREGEVLMMIAEHSFNSFDYQYCSEICSRLVSRNYPSAWKIVGLLAQTEDYDDKTNKKLFLAFAILHCPVENAEKLIESRVQLHEKFLIS